MPWRTIIQTPEKTISYYSQANSDLFIYPPREDIETAWLDYTSNQLAFPFNEAGYLKPGMDMATHCDLVKDGGRTLLRVARMSKTHGPVGQVWYFDTETLHPVRQVDCPLNGMSRQIWHFEYQTLDNGLLFLKHRTETQQMNCRLPADLEREVASGRLRAFDDRVIEGMLYESSRGAVVEYLEVSPDAPIGDEVFEFTVPEGTRVWDEYHKELDRLTAIIMAHEFPDSREAAKAMARSFKTREAVEILVRAKGSNAQTALGIGLALGKTGDRAAIPALMSLFDRPDALEVLATNPMNETLASVAHWSLIQVVHAGKDGDARRREGMEMIPGGGQWAIKDKATLARVRDAWREKLKAEAGPAEDAALGRGGRGGAGSPAGGQGRVEGGRSATSAGRRTEPRDTRPGCVAIPG